MMAEASTTAALRMIFTVRVPLIECGPTQWPRGSLCVAIGPGKHRGTASQICIAGTCRPARGLAVPGRRLGPRPGGRGPRPAVQLIRSWNPASWDRVARVLAQGLPDKAEDGPVCAPRLRQHQRRLAEAEVDRLVTAYEAGASSSDLARAHKIHIHTVVAHLTRRGVSIRPRRAVLTADKHPELLALKAEGWSNSKIARHFGVSATAVYKSLLRASDAT